MNVRRNTVLIAMAASCVWGAAPPYAEPAYAGKWKLDPSKSTLAKAAATIEFVSRGADGLTVKIVDLNASCEASFDGRDYPATGPSVPAGYTLAIRKIDGRSFEMIQKLTGKVLYTSTFQVSSDGKTLTETDSTDSGGEKARAVYYRK